MIKDRICKHCNILHKDIDGKVFANHVRWCNLNPSRNDGNTSLKLSNNIKYGLYTTISFNCLKCNNVFYVTRRSKGKFKKKYCSISCSNSDRIYSLETRNKISMASKLTWKKQEYIDKMFKNNINKNKRFSSKNEKLILKYLQLNKPDDNWTSGGGLKYKDKILTRDIYSDKLRICIEYDGIWHFKDIHGQLQEKKEKDELLKAWCKINKWRIIRISANYYKHNAEPIVDLLESIYGKSKQYIELY